MESESVKAKKTRILIHWFIQEACYDIKYTYIYLEKIEIHISISSDSCWDAPSFSVASPLHLWIWLFQHCSQWHFLFPWVHALFVGASPNSTNSQTFFCTQHKEKLCLVYHCYFCCVTLNACSRTSLMETFCDTDCRSGQ